MFIIILLIFSSWQALQKLYIKMIVYVDKVNWWNKSKIFSIFMTYMWVFDMCMMRFNTTSVKKSVFSRTSVYDKRRLRWHFFYNWSASFVVPNVKQIKRNFYSAKCEANIAESFVFLYFRTCRASSLLSCHCVCWPPFCLHGQKCRDFHFREWAASRLMHASIAAALTYTSVIWDVNTGKNCEVSDSKPANQNVEICFWTALFLVIIILLFNTIW